MSLVMKRRAIGQTEGQNRLVWARPTPRILSLVQVFAHTTIITQNIIIITIILVDDGGKRHFQGWLALDKRSRTFSAFFRSRAARRDALPCIARRYAIIFTPPLSPLYSWQLKLT
jgi:hypothetical protein